MKYLQWPICYKHTPHFEEAVMCHYMWYMYEVGSVSTHTCTLQQVHEALDQQLQSARAENEKIRRLMGEMGVSPRPTVSQWLQQKRLQRKRDMQEALISWDR